MGKSLIIQGIVSKFHFTGTTVTIQTYDSEIGAQQIRRISIIRDSFNCLVGHTLQVKRTLKVTFSKKGN